MPEQTVLITGGAGYIGSHVVLALGNDAPAPETRTLPGMAYREWKSGNTVANNAITTKQKSRGSVLRGSTVLCPRGACPSL